MRKTIIALLVTIVAVAGLALAASPATAAPKNTKACMSLKEWRKIKANNTQTRAQVKRIVGNAGRKGRTTWFSDGTKSFDVTFRQCGRPSYYTTWLSFETKVLYGKYTWDSTKTYVEGRCVGGYASYGYDSCLDYTEGYFVGGYVWDAYEPRGVTSVAKVSYKGSF